MSIKSRDDLLVAIVEMRFALLQASSQLNIEERLQQLCNGLLWWAKLPRSAQIYYAKPILDMGFELAAQLEESPLLDEMHRQSIELSLWQAMVDLKIPSIDERANKFINNRCRRLEKAVSLGAGNSVVKLVYAWDALLSPRTQSCIRLPGPYLIDVARFVDALANAGLPRRAKAIASKFQYRVDPLINWSIDHRPQTDETSRTVGLRQRIASPSEPIPYRAFVRIRALDKILVASLQSLPLSVSTTGHIHIGDAVFGGVSYERPTRP